MSIVLLTLSGAHATGKSTIVEELKQALSDTTAVIGVPSTSLAWINKQRKTNPDFSYDDINRLGMREQMQAELPGTLADLIRQTLVLGLSVLVRPPEDKQVDDVVIIVDRWLADMATYTLQEIHEDGPLALVFGRMRQALENVEMAAGATAALGQMDIRFEHVFVHLEGTEGFEIDEKAQRATTDRLEWEGILGHVWNSYTIGRSTHLRTGDRAGRIEQCVRAIRSPHPG